MAKWRNGEMAKWRNGEMAKWRNGEMAKWRKSQLQKLSIVIRSLAQETCCIKAVR